MTTATKVSNCQSMQELRRYLKRKRLTARDAFQLPRTLRMLVRQDALEFELNGDILAVADLYNQLSLGLTRLTQKVPPIYRPLIESSADFWKSETDKASKRVDSNNKLTVNLKKTSSIEQKIVSGSRRKPGERRSSQTTQRRRGQILKTHSRKIVDNEEKIVPRTKPLVLSRSQAANPNALEPYIKPR
jgi:hypothetical protein